MVWKSPFFRDVSSRAIAVLVAAGVLAVLSMIWPPTRSFVFGMPTAFGEFFGWLTEAVAISRWWYWLLLLVFIGAVVSFSYNLIWPRFSSYRRYSEDTFETILWRWKWARRGSAEEGEPYQIKPYCPNCEVGLTHKRSVNWFEHSEGRRTPPHYECLACHTEFPHVAPDDVRREIMRIKRERWPEARR